MKCLYVLTSTEQDLYYEECYISVVSLLRRNPEAEVYLLTDDRTAENLKGFRGKIKEMVKEMMVVPFPEEMGMMQRSRMLKTTMRKHMMGDFLYIDCDTVIADSLSDVEKCAGSILAVPDKHAMIQEHYTYMNMYMNAKAMGYSMGHGNYHFNSGVMYIRDTEQAQDFFSLWNKLYLETWKKGLAMDQLSLNEANERMGGLIKELDGVWNVQVNTGLRYVAEARIIHYLGYQPASRHNAYFNTLPFLLADEKMLREVRQQGGITEKVGEMIKRPKRAFRNSYILGDDCPAYSLLFSNHMRILKYIYVRHRKMYLWAEKIYGKAFRRFFGRS
jgi:lipopolysaccharide biosynthesis glycosyltransferase